MADGTCSVEGCERKRHNRHRLCTMHLQRLKRYGEVGPAESVRRAPIKGTTVEEKLRLNHTVDPVTGCWRWNGSHAGNGYGCFILEDGGKKGVHRVAYEFFRGPIPAGLVIDHVWAWGCRHLDCFYPGHLEAVTLAENNRRNSFARRTHCINGHEFTPENIYIRPGAATGRACKECRRNRTRAWRLA